MKLIRGFMLSAAAVFLMAAAPAIAPPGPEPSLLALGVAQAATIAMDVAAFAIGALLVLAAGVAIAREAVALARTTRLERRLEPHSRRVRSAHPRASPSHYLTPT